MNYTAFDKKGSKRAGRDQRLPQQKITKQVLTGNITERRCRRRPKNNWLEAVQRHIRQREMRTKRPETEKKME